MIRNCLLCGVGGQGTVLASKLISAAAMQRGDDVRTAETIGMAQRGGCVVSHVRIGRDIHSPMIPLGQAQIILAFEPAEAARCLPYLVPGGTVVVNRKAVQPVTATLSGKPYDAQAVLDYLAAQVENLVVLDGDAVCAQCGSPRVLNVALLGAAAQSGALGLTCEELSAAIMQRVKPQFHSLNLQALALGAQAAEKELSHEDEAGTV
ncbi:MAG: indolepyruvate oxidoreductase subunit beta [Eubacteriales bacterium]|nr:indolepyruvate oxidoreductase subunit beta [Eubacteriales bacterium]